MIVRLTALALLVACGISSLAAAPARADEVVIYGSNGVPRYERWQPAWDRYEYDRHHVILGTVTRFDPYRLQIARRDGDVQMIDLKNGTVILPTGATPMTGEHIAIVGYYSNGTFIANRVVIKA